MRRLCLSCSESVKFGHVTFFWNGNRSGYFDEKYEKYVEIATDKGIQVALSVRAALLLSCGTHSCDLAVPNYERCFKGYCE